MESSFQKRETNFIVNLRNNHDTYLAASDDERSLTLVSHTGVGSLPKSTEWTVNLSSGTSKFTEFNLQSVHGKELAAQKTDNGEVVVHQKNPCPDRPFCWRFDNSQLPLTSGVYMSCDCDTRDWISDFYKLCATQDGTITTKPSFDDTLQGPGAWWFIEVVEKSASETVVGSEQAAPETVTSASVICPPSSMHYRFSDIEQQKQQQGSLISPIHYQESISYKWRAPDCSQQFLAGKNSNGSGNQNIGDVKIENKFSVTEAGYPMTPTGFGTFIPSLHNQVGNTPSHGAFFSPNQDLGNGTHCTSSKDPTISTVINAGNNSNSSGTQTNNVTIKNEVPIYRHSLRRRNIPPCAKKC